MAVAAFFTRVLTIVSLVAGAAFVTDALAEDDDDFLLFDDRPLEQPLEFPDWFKLSFLDLRDDLKEVRQEGKDGLMVYFGQKYCAYCRKFLEKDLTKEDIRTYIEKHFDVIGIDIHGQRMVTDLAGREMDERKFAVKEHTNFTPSVIFYDRDGHESCVCAAIIPRIVFVRRWNTWRMIITARSHSGSTSPGPMFRWYSNPAI